MFGRLGIFLMMRRMLPLAWSLLKDRRVPLSSKLLLPGGLLYTLFPLDLMPDFFPALGQLDDLTVFALAILLFIRVAPKEVVREHLERRAGRVPRPDPGRGRRGEVIDGDYEILN